MTFFLKIRTFTFSKNRTFPKNPDFCQKSLHMRVRILSKPLYTVLAKNTVLAENKRSLAENLRSGRKIYGHRLKIYGHSFMTLWDRIFWPTVYFQLDRIFNGPYNMTIFKKEVLNDEIIRKQSFLSKTYVAWLQYYNYKQHDFLR